MSAVGVGSVVTRQPVAAAPPGHRFKLALRDGRGLALEQDKAETGTTKDPCLCVPDSSYLFRMVIR